MMLFTTRRRGIAAVGALFLATTLVVGCDGDATSINSGVLFNPGTTPSPQVSAPTVITLHVAFNDVGPYNAVCCLGDISVEYTVPPNDQSTTPNAFTLSFSTVPLSGLPALSSHKRKPSSLSPPAGAAVVYFSFSSPVAATFSYFPLQGVDFGHSVAGQSFYLAGYDPTNAGAGWQTIGPCTNTATGTDFPGADTPFSVRPGVEYGIVLYSVM